LNRACAVLVGKPLICRESLSVGNVSPQLIDDVLLKVYVELVEKTLLILQGVSINAGIALNLTV
jgi:hypothetical protein